MPKHIYCLDGIRGSLALWVFWGHVAAAVGFHPPVLSAPALAVDLFMLLSGFLMAWHWNRADGRESPTGAKVMDFYTRRCFRIAPLYYVLLVVALVLSPAFFEAQSGMHRVYPFPWAEEAGESAPPTINPFAPDNILLHLTFVFGAIPRYAANNPLPDWSIGLEMQFYLLFPLLAVFLRKTRVLFLTVAALGLVMLNARLFGLYLEPGRFGTFPQPSMLLFKLHIFVAGMALARLVASDRDRSTLVYGAAFVIPLLFLHKVVALAAVGIAVLLLADWKPTNLVRDLLGRRAFKFLGDISYSVYLVHTMPLYFLLHALQQRGLFEGMSPLPRFAIAVSILTPLVLGLAWALHRLVELPGISLGRRVARRWRKDRPALRPGTPKLALSAKVSGN